MPKFLAAAAAALFLLGSCAPRAGGDWATFQNHFIDQYFELNPTFAAYQGRHEFDGRLPD